MGESRLRRGSAVTVWLGTKSLDQGKRARGQLRVPPSPVENAAEGEYGKMPLGWGEHGQPMQRAGLAPVRCEPPPTDAEAPSQAAKADTTKKWALAWM